MLKLKLKFCLTVVLLLGFVHANSANAATCIMRKYRIRALWQFFIIKIYDRPDGSGVWSPQWEDFNTYPSDGSLIDEIIAWEGIIGSLEFLGFQEYSCSHLPPDDPDDDDGCNNSADCCGLGCLNCFGFDPEKYEFLIPFFPPCDDEEECHLNLTIRGSSLPARRGTARISGDWCKSLSCDGSYNKFLKIRDFE